MNVAVFGWYHHRNAGDDRLQEVLTRWLDGHTLAFLPAGRPVSASFLRTWDLALIGGGGIVSRRGGMFRDLAGRVRQARIPTALVGVGVNALPPDLAGELRAFLDSPWCVFAWVRDRVSLEALGSHPKALVGPDLSWLYPVRPAEGEGRGVAVCLRRRSGLPVDRWARVLNGLPEPVRPWPLYFEGRGDASVMGALAGAEAMPDAFTLAPVHESRSVVSARFHGMLFALQAGRPVVGVGDSPKVVRFLDEHGLGRWRVKEEEPEALPELWGAFQDAHADLRVRVRDLAADTHREAEDLAAGLLPRLEEAGRRAAEARGRRIRRRLDGLVDRWL